MGGEVKSLFGVFSHCVTNGWTDGWVDGWMDGWTNGGRDRPTDGWTYQPTNQQSEL